MTVSLIVPVAVAAFRITLTLAAYNNHAILLAMLWSGVQGGPGRALLARGLLCSCSQILARTAFIQSLDWAGRPSWLATGAPVVSAARWPQGSQTAFREVGFSNTIVPREPGGNCMAFHDLKRKSRGVPFILLYWWM